VGTPPYVTGIVGGRVGKEGAVTYRENPLNALDTSIGFTVASFSLIDYSFHVFKHVWFRFFATPEF
jgi:hypothetical protein